MATDRFPIATPAGEVSALLDVPARATAAYVFAHGAGAGMEHAFMAKAAAMLASRDIATLRFNFPFTEAGSKRPDAPAAAQATVRAAVDEARRRFPGIPLFAGGKSFGGRMTSAAQAQAPLADVRGLVFFGFPLHPSGMPGTARADHLAKVTLPMLFLQGTRDALAEPALIAGVVATLQPRARLVEIEGADHGFAVLKRSGRDDAAVMAQLADAASAWMRAT